MQRIDLGVSHIAAMLIAGLIASAIAFQAGVWYERLVREEPRPLLWGSLDEIRYGLYGIRDEIIPDRKGLVVGKDLAPPTKDELNQFLGSQMYVEPAILLDELKHGRMAPMSDNEYMTMIGHISPREVQEACVRRHRRDANSENTRQQPLSSE